MGKLKDPRLPLPLNRVIRGVRHKRITPLTMPRRLKLELSVAEYLAGMSKFGGTSLERLIDGAAAQLGFQFDYAQYYIPLTATGSYTIVDRVLVGRHTLVYLDGPQHEMRMDHEQTDLLQKFELESMGWTVVRLNWQDVLRDPIGAARRILWGF